MPLRRLAIAVAASLLRIAEAQDLPYVPTTILIPEANVVPLQQNVSANVAYIFSAKSDTVGLFTLDVSGSVDASSVSLTPISTSLPFLGGDGTAFVPSLSDNGSLIIYAGDCSTSDGTSVWTLDPATNNGAPSWTQLKTKRGPLADATKMGACFLGSSFSFSTTLEPIMSRASVYVYGGMCPDATSNATSPQAKAAYSNNMVRLTPSKSDDGAYDVSLVTNPGPPIPEAGFTFTGLSPSISNRTGTVTQQANYVLLGGHTKTAFINMSTVAIWSLPQETWTFMSDIDMAPSGAQSTDLRSPITSIDSRSGHTAVLSEDGASLIILGGWVGDLSQAASPQLAILEIGTAYGGQGNWQWSVPEAQPDSGVYGHGAALLPGNVMMVYGGYDIAAPSSKKTRRSHRRDVHAPMFLNLTSMTWISAYANPYYTGDSTAQVASTTSQGDLSRKQLGLGLGLSLGLAAIAAALLIYFWYRRRLRRRRTMRNSALQALAQDESRYVYDVRGDKDDGLNGGYAWYMSGAGGRQYEKHSLGYESLRGTRGSMDAGQDQWPGDYSTQPIKRKPVAPHLGRGQYQQAPTSSFDPVPPPPPPHGPRQIHPIYEADEDGSLHDADIANEKIRASYDPRPDHDHDDPFATPPHEQAFTLPPPTRAIRTPSPDRVRRKTDPDVQDWMTDIDAADALLSGRMAPRAVVTTAGRTSPTRRGTNRSSRSIGQNFADDDSRTGSNLSESARSNLSGGSGSIRLKPPPGFGLASAAAAASTAEGRGDTAGSGTSGSSASGPSYNTARTSFHALQAEGPSLLLGNNRNQDFDDTPGSPSKSKPRRGWLGSLRRVFSGRSGHPSPPSSDHNDSPTRDMFGETNDFDNRLGGLGEIAAGGLLRRKGGRGAWADRKDGSSGFAGPDSGRYLRAKDNDDDDDDWDIEKEVEKRLVQVMFTVPKERLRVVNAEPDMDGESAILVEVGKKSSRESLPAAAANAAAAGSGAGRDAQDGHMTPIQPPTPPRTTSPHGKGLALVPAPIFEIPSKDDSDQYRTFSFEGEVLDVILPGSKKDTLDDVPPPPPAHRTDKDNTEATKKEHRRFSFQPEVLSVSPQAQERLASGGKHNSIRDMSQDARHGEIGQEEPDSSNYNHNNNNNDSYKEPAAETEKEVDGARLAALERELSRLGKELEADQLSRRPLSDMSIGVMSDAFSEADVLSAEAVRMARPAAKTRVLQMVESFESMTSKPAPRTTSPRIES